MLTFMQYLLIIPMTFMFYYLKKPKYNDFNVSQLVVPLFASIAVIAILSPVHAVNQNLMLSSADEIELVHAPGEHNDTVKLNENNKPKETITDVKVINRESKKNDGQEHYKFIKQVNYADVYGINVPRGTAAKTLIIYYP